MTSGIGHNMPTAVKKSVLDKGRFMCNSFGHQDYGRQLFCSSDCISTGTKCGIFVTVPTFMHGVSREWKMQTNIMMSIRVIWERSQGSTVLWCCTRSDYVDTMDMTIAWGIDPCSWVVLVLWLNLKCFSIVWYTLQNFPQPQCPGCVWDMSWTSLEDMSWTSQVIYNAVFLTLDTFEQLLQTEKIWTCQMISPVMRLHY
jgi:hypothetical protein